MKLNKLYESTACFKEKGFEARAVKLTFLFKDMFCFLANGRGAKKSERIFKL